MRSKFVFYRQKLVLKSKCVQILVILGQNFGYFRSKFVILSEKFRFKVTICQNLVFWRPKSDFKVSFLLLFLRKWQKLVDFGHWRCNFKRIYWILWSDNLHWLFQLEHQMNSQQQNSQFELSYNRTNNTKAKKTNVDAEAIGALDRT